MDGWKDWAKGKLTVRNGSKLKQWKGREREYLYEITSCEVFSRRFCLQIGSNTHFY